MTKIEIKKELISKLDEICDNEFFIDEKQSQSIKDIGRDSEKIQKITYRCRMNLRC